MKFLKNKSLIDGFIIGAALFSMFFGAGNMIFPPYLGLKAGKEWLLGFSSYYLADIGLALVAIFAQIRNRGYKKLLRPLGNRMSSILIFIVILCIGPIISIPRTAATTFELSVISLVPGFNMIVFYIIFFLVVLFLCIRRSAVVDIIGKILTPVLFIGLLFLIIKGILDPLGTISLPSRSESIIADGIEAGYQSMDFLAAIIFGVFILNSTAERGHTAEKAQAKVAAGAGIVAGIGLLIVYFGLTYLGATVSSAYNMHISRTELLIAIINGLLPGKVGIIFFAVIAALACISTAIAITSAAAEYFSEISKNKLRYEFAVVLICLFGGVISCLGVEQLIKLASPILSFIYPPIFVAVVLSFFLKMLNIWCVRFAAYTALIVGLLDIVSTYLVRIDLLFSLPFYSLGLSWLLPSLAAGVIGQIGGKFFCKKRGNLVEISVEKP